MKWRFGLEDKKLDGIEYWVKGIRPKVIIHSGIHGDEGSIVPILEDLIKENEEQFPDFLAITKASPSALEKKTRENIDGVDLNRSFREGTGIKEAKVNMEIIDKYQPYEIYFGFHEDPEVDRVRDFYIYDSGSMRQKKYFRDFVDKLKTYGLNTFNGVDDLLDPDLGLKIVDGYISTPKKDFDAGNGFVISWLITTNRCKRVMEFEIPSIWSTDQKTYFLKVFFEDLLPNLI